MIPGLTSWREWPVASSTPQLSADTIHVFAFSLDVANTTLRALEETLCPAERARARRFIHGVHQRRYMASRGVLRIVLSGVLHCRPEDVRLETGRRGKPQLADQSPAVQFNISHSEDLALVAVSIERAVGIDVEHHEPRIAWRGVARTLLADECREIEKLAPDQQLAAFYTCWSRKEAVLKARGDGFSATDAPTRSWWVAEVPVGPALAASVASEAPRANLELYRMPA